MRLKVFFGQFFYALNLQVRPLRTPWLPKDMVEDQVYLPNLQERCEGGPGDDFFEMYLKCIGKLITNSSVRLRRSQHLN